MKVGCIGTDINGVKVRGNNEALLHWERYPWRATYYVVFIQGWWSRHIPSRLLLATVVKRVSLQTCQRYGQSEPAATNAPVGRSVHWMGCVLSFGARWGSSQSNSFCCWLLYFVFISFFYSFCWLLFFVFFHFFILFVVDCCTLFFSIYLFLIIFPWTWPHV
jgi:hypothetical protein